MRRKLGRDRLLDRLARRIGIGLLDRIERGLDALEHRARALHRDDHIVEGRRGRIGGDARDLGGVDRHALLEPGLVILVPDPVERRRAEGQGARLREDVRGRHLGEPGGLGEGEGQAGKEGRHAVHIVGCFQEGWP